MGMRSTWKGSVSCGLLNVPVKMYSATEEKSIRFNQVHSCGSKIKLQKHCPHCDSVVQDTELKKGYDVGGSFVFIEENELESVKLSSIKTIEITEFSSPASVDPRLPNKAYFIAPEKGGAKAFGLLLEGMKQENMWAVGKVVMREKEYVAILRPFNGVILLQTLFWADELRDPGEITPDKAVLADNEVVLVRTLIDTMKGNGDFTKYEDTYRKAVEGLIEKKAAGEVIAIPEKVEEIAPEQDTVAALLASIQSAKDKPKWSDAVVSSFGGE